MNALRLSEKREWSITMKLGQEEGRTTLCVSVSHTGGGDGRCGNGECGERLLRCRYGIWTMSMALLDMLVGHDPSVLRIALLCDLRMKER